MRRRGYWLLPDLTSARATMDDLLLAGVDLRQMHLSHGRIATCCSSAECAFLYTSGRHRGA